MAFTIGGGGRMMYSITEASVPASGDHSAGGLVRLAGVATPDFVETIDAAISVGE